MDDAPRPVLDPAIADYYERTPEAAAQPLRSCRVGDARALEMPAASADIVLLLGPLYHMTESSDGARALAEAARVLLETEPAMVGGSAHLLAVARRA